MKQRITNQLAALPGFGSMKRAEVEAVARLTMPAMVTAGTVLTTQGRTGREAFLLTSGTASVARNGHAIATVRPGAFIGELAVLDGGSRSATVVCDTDCRMLVLSHSDLHELMVTAPTLAKVLRTTLAGRVRSATMIEGAL